MEKQYLVLRQTKKGSVVETRRTDKKAALNDMKLLSEICHKKVFLQEPDNV